MDKRFVFFGKRKNKPKNNIHQKMIYLKVKRCNTTLKPSCLCLISIKILCNTAYSLSDTKFHQIVCESLHWFVIYIYMYILSNVVHYTVYSFTMCNSEKPYTSVCPQFNELSIFIAQFPFQTTTQNKNFDTIYTRCYILLHIGYLHIC